jgi:hypothetical protein
VAPEPLVLGSVSRGGTVSKKVVVRGKEPFRILKVEGNEDLFQFKTDAESSPMHIVEVVFAPKGDAGQVKQSFRIVTDKGESYQVMLTAYATVVDPAAGTAEREPAPTGVRRSAANAGAASRDSVVGQD